MFLGNCQAGTFINPANESECLPCAFGEFSDMMWQLSCQSCPDDTTTLMLGADSSDDCVGKSNNSSYSFLNIICAFYLLVVLVKSQLTVPMGHSLMWRRRRVSTVLKEPSERRTCKRCVRLVLIQTLRRLARDQ